MVGIARSKVIVSQVSQNLRVMSHQCAFQTLKLGAVAYLLGYVYDELPAAPSQALAEEPVYVAFEDIEAEVGGNMWQCSLLGAPGLSSRSKDATRGS